MRLKLLSSALALMSLAACSDQQGGAFGPPTADQWQNPGTWNPILVPPNSGNGNVVITPGTGYGQRVPSGTVATSFNVTTYNNLFEIGSFSVIDQLNINNQRNRIDIYASSQFRQVNVSDNLNLIRFLPNPDNSSIQDHRVPAIRISGSNNRIELYGNDWRYFGIGSDISSGMVINGSNNQISVPCGFQTSLITWQVSSSTTLERRC